jgi:hypothetical protein
MANDALTAIAMQEWIKIEVDALAARREPVDQIGALQQIVDILKRVKNMDACDG